jgi:two-component system response regulator GlrR
VTKILVVDDDRNILKVIRMRLEAEEYHVTTAANSADAIKFATQECYDMGLVDLKLGREDGIELMDDLFQANPRLPIIILTAYGTIKSAVEAMRRGARSYITKPFDYEELLQQIKKNLEQTQLTREIRRLRNLVSDQFGFENIIGQSAKMKNVYEQVAKAANSDACVHIEGESGTGKELIAKSLHVASPRKQGPFFAINCAAIPETLLESELFGHRKGAFTGATLSKKGLLAQTQGGSFFLDEISEMPLSMQAKLLRVIQEKEYFPLGGAETVKLDCRLIASSNKSLKELVNKGQFREDLYFRVVVILIQLPPLRERKEDIPLLADHFLKQLCHQMKKDIRGFSTAAVQKLMYHSWPGNVRELRNTVERAVAMATRDIITEKSITQTSAIQHSLPRPLKGAKEEFEKQYLIQLLGFTQGNVSRSAKLAGKHRSDLYDLVKKYELNIDDYRKP